MPPLLSIVVVSYNTRDLLRRCLASVVESPFHRTATQLALPLGCDPTPESPNGVPLACELFVVDNASRDGSPEMVATEFPGVRLISSDRNLGFARATNQGLEAATGDYLLLLNPDTEVLDNALPEMVGYLGTHPGVGIVGPSLVFPDGRPQHAAFRFPTLWMSLFDFFPLNHRFIDSSVNGRYPPSTDGRPFPVDHPLGAALMTKRETLEEVGLLDDGFFMYCEEVDWCLRARRMGWEIMNLPYVKIIHHVGQSSKQVRAEMLIELHRSRYRLFRKHYSRGFITAHRAITRLGLAREAMRAAAQRRAGLLPKEQYREMVRAYRAIWSM